MCSPPLSAYYIPSWLTFITRVLEIVCGLWLVLLGSSLPNLTNSRRRYVVIRVLTNAKFRGCKELSYAMREYSPTSDKAPRGWRYDLDASANGEGSRRAFSPARILICLWFTKWLRCIPKSAEPSGSASRPIDPPVHGQQSGKLLRVQAGAGEETRAATSGGVQGCDARNRRTIRDGTIYAVRELLNGAVNLVIGKECYHWENPGVNANQDKLRGWTRSPVWSISSEKRLISLRMS